MTCDEDRTSSRRHGVCCYQQAHDCRLAHQNVALRELFGMDLCRLAHDAWTDVGSMLVLVDTMLERGLLLQGTSANPDVQLRHLEAAARIFIVRLYTDLEVDPVGAGPEEGWHVWRRWHGENARVRIPFCGPLWQPRMLRHAYSVLTEPSASWHYDREDAYAGRKYLGGEPRNLPASRADLQRQALRRLGDGEHIADIASRMLTTVPVVKAAIAEALQLPETTCTEQLAERNDEQILREAASRAESRFQQANRRLLTELARLTQKKRARGEA